MIHEDILPVERHAPCSFEYASASARSAASGFLPGDVGKLAWQTDNNTLWILTATTPTWQVVGDGGSASPSIASGSVSGHKVVVFSDVNTVVYADNQTLAHSQIVIGVTRGAALNGDEIFIAKNGDGITEGSWNWTAGSVIYLGANGALTQTPPVAPAVFSLIVGYAISATTMYVQIREPIHLI